MMKIFTIVALLILTQGCGDSGNKIKVHLNKGKSYFQEGNYGKAKIEFNNILQLNPKNAEAYYQLALVDEKNQHWQGMRENLSMTTQLDPQNYDALLKLGRLSLLSGEIDDALSQSEKVLIESVDNRDALILKGSVFIKQGRLQEAMALAEQVLKQHPESPDAVGLKTAVYSAKKDNIYALATVENALKTNPDNLTLLLLRLQLHQQDKNIEAVEHDYLEIINLYPDKFEYTSALAKHYSDTNQEHKASSVLEALINSHPDDVQPKLALVEHQMQKNPELAEKTLLAYAAQYPQQIEYPFQLASLYIKQNKLPDARQSLLNILNLKPASKESQKAKIILAKIALQENNSAGADNYLNDVLAADEDNLEVALLKAQLDLKKGFYDEVISRLNTVLESHPNSVDALTMIGQAYLNNNSPELADESFRKVLTINPANFDALMRVVFSLIKNNEAAKADKLMIHALKVMPDHPLALQGLAQIRLLQKDWIGAQQVADIIASKPQGAGFSKFLSGKISEEQGYFKEATGQYKEALFLSPELSDALKGLATSYEALKQNKAMFAYLEDYLAAHTDIPYPWLLKSQLLLKDNRIEEATETLSNAISKWPKVVEFYEALATNYRHLNDLDNAISTLNKGLEVNPNNIRLNILLSSLYNQTREYAKSLDIYESLIVKYPTVDIVANNLATVLLDHFKTKENIDRAVSLTKRFGQSGQPVLADTYAWALVNSGQNEEALKLLGKIVKKVPESPVFRYHLGVAYHQTNKVAQAISELEEALKLGEKTGKFAEKEAAVTLLKKLKGES
jgi:tetratricopeptide (TPR) repeat protein